MYYITIMYLYTYIYIYIHVYIYIYIDLSSNDFFVWSRFAAFSRSVYAALYIHQELSCSGVI